MPKSVDDVIRSEHRRQRLFSPSQKLGWSNRVGGTEAVACTHGVLQSRTDLRSDRQDKRQKTKAQKDSSSIGAVEVDLVPSSLLEYLPRRYRRDVFILGRFFICFQRRHFDARYMRALGEASSPASESLSGQPSEIPGEVDGQEAKRTVDGRRRPSEGAADGPFPRTTLTETLHMRQARASDCRVERWHCGHCVAVLVARVDLEAAMVLRSAGRRGRDSAFFLVSRSQLDGAWRLGPRGAGWQSVRGRSEGAWQHGAYDGRRGRTDGEKERTLKSDCHEAVDEVRGSATKGLYRSLWATTGGLAGLAQFAEPEQRRAEEGRAEQSSNEWKTLGCCPSYKPSCAAPGARCWLG
ncbi:hypothetical protein AXG93_2752s1640 [Marchantia polymorpha subsp. ruderalis]|uniref:Uncharacterized protein n=1 Tax=Marchantia polymorpha subsp. ruderalis TaxID=1480154 RepID=A0A176VTN4_MARPO|nr:hypothetical protein AXG93_2752s1640 [Marchantia polymorpha subsp. ruderalis]